MPMFSSFRSTTADSSLEDILEHLERSPDVSAVFLLGSTATGPAPWSDYDLLLVTTEGEPFDFEVAFVDGRATDIVFVANAELARILPRDRASTARERDIVGWLAASRLVSPPDGGFEDVPERARRILGQSRIDDREMYYRWVEANFTLMKMRRYATAEDPVYWDALEVMLAKALSELPCDYVISRGRSWMGEKEAMAFLGADEPEFLIDLKTALRSTSLDEKVERYGELMTRAFAPIGSPWATGHTAAGWFRFDGEPHERSRWEALFRSHARSPESDT